MSSPAEPFEPVYRSFRTAVPALVFLTSLFLLNFTARLVLAPLLPLIEADLDLSHTGSGSFFLFISSGYCLAILGSGLVTSRLSHKRTIVLSTLLCGLVLALLAFCSSAASFRAGLFLLGLSAGLYLPSGVATITSAVAPAYWARGVAIHELAPNFGFVLVPLVSAVLLNWFSWSRSLLILGLVLLLAGIAYGLSPTPDAGVGRRPELKVYRRLSRSGAFWIMVALFSMAICSTLGLYTMLPLYLVTERGYDQEAANRLVSLSRLSSVLMPLAAGWFGDRFGNRSVMAAVLCCGGLLTIPIGLTGGGLLLLFVFLQPLVAVCFFPSGFATLAGIGGPGYGNLAVSLCIPLAFLIGGGMVPTLVGLIGDRVSLGAGFSWAGLAIVSAGLLAAWFARQRPSLPGRSGQGDEDAG